MPYCPDSPSRETTLPKGCSILCPPCHSDGHWLSLQSNRLTKIEGLQSLANLRELYLSHNGIEVIEGLENNVRRAPVRRGGWARGRAAHSWQRHAAHGGPGLVCSGRTLPREVSRRALPTSPGSAGGALGERRADALHHGQCSPPRGARASPGSSHCSAPCSAAAMTTV